jgi:hypothetical protein
MTNSSWGHGSSGRAMTSECKVLSSNPSTAKKKDKLDVRFQPKCGNRDWKYLPD